MEGKGEHNEKTKAQSKIKGHDGDGTERAQQIGALVHAGQVPQTARSPISVYGVVNTTANKAATFKFCHRASAGERNTNGIFGRSEGTHSNASGKKVILQWNFQPIH